MVQWKTCFWTLLVLSCCCSTLQNANELRIKRDNGDDNKNVPDDIIPEIPDGVVSTASPTEAVDTTVTVDTTVEGTVATTVERTVATTVEGTVATTVEETVATTVEGTVATTVEGTVATTVEGTVATTAEGPSTGKVDAEKDNVTSADAVTNETDTTAVEATTPPTDSCPMNVTAIKLDGWNCRSPCSDTRKCRNKKSECKCETPCGMVCIPSDLKCKRPTTISNGTVEIPQGLFYQQKIKYSCDDGFELIHGPERTCRGDQNWSGPQPFCTKAGVRCPAPSVQISNTTSDIPADKTEFYLKDEVTYVCAKGFEPEVFVQNFIICEENEKGEAEWTNITLNCLPNPCENPEDLEDGSYEGGNFTFGEEITYSCNFGFDLIGEAVRKCQDNGTWSGKLPRCFLPKDECPIPKEPEHGSVKYPSERLFGHVVHYECEVGFKLNGTSQRKCDKEGIWTDEDPTCEVVTCGDPEKPRNGSIIFLSGSTYSKQVDYSCDDNSTPSGPTSSTCEQDGTWTPPAPVCLSHCEIEDFPKAYMVPTSAKDYVRYNMIPLGIFLPHDMSAQIVCDDGFEVPNNESEVKPISEVQCNDGNWFPSSDCQPARCFCRDIEHKELKNRKMILSRECKEPTASGNELVLKCDPKFPEPVTKGNLPCIEGKWAYPNDTDVRCQLRSCSVTDVKIQNGAIYKNDELWTYDPAVDGTATVLHGTQLRFECTDPGYELFIDGKALYAINSTENVTIRECEDGIWSGRTPVCKPGRCQCDEITANRSESIEVVDCTDLKQSSQYAQFQCAEGYSDPTGSLFIQCLNRMWQKDPPQCKEMCSCDALDLELNDTVTFKECKDFIRSGKPVVLQCAYGFANFTGIDEVTCEDGNWTNIDAFCTESTEPFETTLEPMSTSSDMANTTDMSVNATDVTDLSANVTDVSVNATELDLNATTLDPGNETLSANDTTPGFNETDDSTFPSTTEGSTACVFEIETIQLQAFFEGRILSETSNELPHGSIVRLRCANILNFKFEGSHVLECKNGKWSHPKPKCFSLRTNSRKTAPPFWISATPPQQPRITEEGVMVIRKHSAVHITCLWSEQQPVMVVEGPIKQSATKEFRIARMAGWQMDFEPVTFVTVFNYTCSIPDADPESKLSHTLTMKISDICLINEKSLAKSHGVIVVGSTRRSFYTEGDVVETKCVDFSVEKAFQKMTCISQGRWSYGPAEPCSL